MSYLGLLPVSLVLLAAVTFGVSYIVAVVRGDVAAVFPYISDTGSKRPESCIFGQLLNIVAFLAFWTMCIRYKAVQAMSHVTLNDNRRLHLLNRSSLVVGLISAFGVSVVANFQEGTIVEAVHVIGAFMAFVPGVVYCCLQTILSYHMYPDYNGLYICRLRFSISITASASIIITIIAAAFAIHEYNSNEHIYINKFKWAPGVPGYTPHIISTSGEWITALTFLFFFFTYVKEFDELDMEIRTRPLDLHLDQVLDSSCSAEVNERSALLA